MQIIPFTHEFTIQNRSVEIDIKQIPKIPSFETIQIIGTLAPNAGYVASDLSSKITSLNQTIAELTEINNDPVKYKIFECLKSALLISVLALGIFSAVLGGPVALTVLSFIAYAILSSWIYLKNDGPIEEGVAILALIASPFIPIWNVFNKISNLETLVAKKQEECKQGKTDLERELNRSIDYYVADQLLLSRLQAAIAALCETNMGHLPHSESLQKAEEELTALTAYYKKLATPQTSR